MAACPSCGVEEAVASPRGAVALFERKGAAYVVDQVQQLIEEWTR